MLLIILLHLALGSALCLGLHQMQSLASLILAEHFQLSLQTIQAIVEEIAAADRPAAARKKDTTPHHANQSKRSNYSR